MIDNLYVAVDDTAVVEEEVISQDSSDETPNWITPLRDTNGDFRIIEFGKHEYLFREVLDPSRQGTNKYSVFYRDLTVPEENQHWEVLRGLLSGLYTVASVENFYNVLSQQLGTQQEPEILGVPFALICKSRTTHSINMFQDEAMRVAFELITGIDLSAITNVHSSVDVCVSNSYDGTKSIHMDYVIRTVAGNHVYHDYFILANHSHSFEHITHSLGEVTADLTNVQGYLTTTINTLKGLSSGIDDFVAGITKRMKKITRAMFNSYWENVPVSHKNVLFALVITSHCLNTHYDIRQHIDLRSYVNSNIQKLFANSR